MGVEWSSCKITSIPFGRVYFSKGIFGMDTSLDWPPAVLAMQMTKNNNNDRMSNDFIIYSSRLKAGNKRRVKIGMGTSGQEKHKTPQSIVSIRVNLTGYI